jgi:hypothetical protein
MSSVSTPHPDASEAPAPAPAFETEIKTAVLDLRESLGEALCRELPPGFKAVELHRSFGVDRRLGWMITRLVQDEDIYEASRHFPGEAGLRRFLKAAKAKRLDSELLDRAERAGVRVARIIETHSGDRETFDMLLAGLAGDARDEEEVAQRKAVFNASGFVYGVQAQARLAMHVLTPSACGEMVDVATVRGFVGLRRLRPDQPWPLMVRRWVHDDGSVNSRASFEPIDPEGLSDPDGAPLIARFCTPSNPDVSCEVLGEGVREYMLGAAPVGNSGAMTCLLGEVARSVGSRFKTPQDATADLSAAVRTPVASLLLDHYIHPDLVGFGTPEFSCFTEVHRFARGGGPRAEHDRLNPLCRVQDLGSGRAASRVPDIAWYSDMVQHVFNKLGHDLATFRCFRVSVPYPPMASTSQLSYTLPEPG